MSIDLNLTFTGLCLYLPDDRDSARRSLHVLLLAPHLNGHAGHGHPAQGDGRPSEDGGEHDHEHEQHYPYLFYDVAYEQPGATALSGHYRGVHLQDRVLELPAIGQSLDMALRDVPNVSPIAERLVVRDFVGTNPGAKVAARVTLATGRAVEVDAGQPWELGAGNLIPIAFRIVWRVAPLPDQPLELHLGGLNGGPGMDLPPLHPIDGAITLRVVNLPIGELSPEARPVARPAEGSRMHHFRAFYSLFQDPARVLIPIWRGMGVESVMGVSYTCGKAMAELE